MLRAPGRHEEACLAGGLDEVACRIDQEQPHRFALDLPAKDHGGVEVTQQTTPAEAAPLQIDCQAETIDKSNCGIVRYLILFINTN